MEIWKMLVSAKLLSKNQNKIRYAFGPSHTQLDGILCINQQDVNTSFIEKMSQDVPEAWGLRATASIILHIRDEKNIPYTYEYYPGY